MPMKATVFIHTNDKQILGALVSKHSFERFASNTAFDVKLIHTNDHPFLAAHEGRPYLRDGLKRVWSNDDLQSFTVLRFAPPALMNFEGRSVVVDPDVFCVADPTALITRDMQGAAIMARKREGAKSDAWASSVMLLDNQKLKHWNVEAHFEEMFRFERDYMNWITLQTEPQESIGLLEPYWNDFDRLTPETRMVHNTRRRTQPWKSGLKVDFRPPEKAGSLRPAHVLNRVRRAIAGEYGLLGRYKPHPDPNQERLFFALLKECLDLGIVTRDMIREHMRLNHVRHDAFEVLGRTPTLAERPLFAS
jgi:hypothetical protein